MATEIGRHSMPAVAWRGVLKRNRHRKTAIVTALNTGRGPYEVRSGQHSTPFCDVILPPLRCNDAMNGHRCQGKQKAKQGSIKRRIGARRHIFRTGIVETHPGFSFWHPGRHDSTSNRLFWRLFFSFSSIPSDHSGRPLAMAPSSPRLEMDAGGDGVKRKFQTICGRIGGVRTTPDKVLLRRQSGSRTGMAVRHPGCLPCMPLVRDSVFPQTQPAAVSAQRLHAAVSLHTVRNAILHLPRCPCLGSKSLLEGSVVHRRRGNQSQSSELDYLTQLGFRPRRVQTCLAGSLLHRVRSVSAKGLFRYLQFCHINMCHSCLCGTSQLSTGNIGLPSPRPQNSAPQRDTAPTEGRI